MKDQAVNFIQEQQNYIRSRQKDLVIDTDTHITHPNEFGEANIKELSRNDGYFHGMPVTAEQLLNEMDLSEVDMALTWQNPSCINYSTDKEDNYKLLLTANTYIYESSRKYPTRFIPAGWTDPKALGVKGAIRLVEYLINEYGFGIVKMNPAQNQFYLDNPEVVEVVNAIISLGAVPAFHIGSDTPYTPVSALEQIAKKYSDHPIIAVHMGGGGGGYVESEDNYHKIRELGLRYPNLKFPLSAKRDTHIESALVSYELAGEPYNKNLFYASDAPYGKIGWNIGGFRALIQNLKQDSYIGDKRLLKNPGLFNSKTEKRILGGNFANFILQVYDKLLQTQGYMMTK